MKSNSLKNKIIAIILIHVLSLQTALASSDILNKALTNYTPPNSLQIKDSTGNTIKSMYYTGGFYYRFNNSTVNQPLWNFSPPEIEAGCNGINLKGMFVSILGLDQFGAMLQNAGATLAYGVAVGIIYSLPGVASVFKMINQWAKEIQKLLSMACSSGIAIGQSFAEAVGIGFDQTAIDKKIMSYSPSEVLSSKNQEGVSKVFSAIGLDNINMNWDEGITWSGSSEVPDTIKEEMISAPLQKLFGDVSIGGKMYIDHLIKTAGNSGTIEEIKNSLKGISEPVGSRRIVITLNNGSGSFNSNDVLEDSVQNIQSFYTTQEEKDEIGLKFLAYALYYNYVGDVGFDETIVTKLTDIASIFKCATNVTGENPNSSSKSNASGKAEEANQAKGKAASGAAIANETQCQQKLSQELVGNQGTMKMVHTLVGKVSPEVSSAETFKKLILDGHSALSNMDGSVKPMIAPEFLIIATEEDGKDEKSFAITPTNPKVDDNGNGLNTNFFDENGYPGVKKISRCSLYTALDGFVSENISESILSDDGKGNSIDAADCIAEGIDSLLFGEISLYADYLYKSTDVEVATVVKTLVAFNEKLLAEAIISKLSSMIQVDSLASQKPTTATTALTKSNANAVISSDAVRLNQANLTKFSEVVKETKGLILSEYEGINAKSIRDDMKALKEAIDKRTFKQQK